MTAGMVTVTFFPTEAEAELAKGFLATQGIDAVVSCNLPKVQAGPGYLFDVQVTAADERRAVKALAKPLRRRFRRKNLESALPGDQEAGKALGLATAGLYTLPVVFHLASVFLLARLYRSGAALSPVGREQVREAWKWDLIILVSAGVLLGALVVSQIF